MKKVYFDFFLLKGILRKNAYCILTIYLKYVIFVWFHLNTIFVKFILKKVYRLF